MADPRIDIEAEGFEALYRLYEVACGNTGQCIKVARFLLGLYNSPRFPFELNTLRAIDDALFEDCMRVLRMDARVARREIHTYFDDGGRKFEELVKDWGLTEQPPEPVQHRGARNGVFVADDSHFNVEVVNHGHAPGYRSISLIVKMSELQSDGEGAARNVSLNFAKDDAFAAMTLIADINRFAWRNGRRPLDADPDDQPPTWLP